MITPSERIRVCQSCQNRHFDKRLGLVCGLTFQKPLFESVCPDYKIDDKRAKELENFARRQEEEALIEGVGPGKRFVNLLVDYAAKLGITFVIAFGLASSGVFLPDIFGNMRLNELFYGYLISFIYYNLFEISTGRTIGKFLTGTIVVNEQGQRADSMRVLKQTLCRFIPFDAFSYLGDGIGWHDTISGTRVIPLENVKGGVEGQEIILDEKEWF